MATKQPVKEKQAPLTQTKAVAPAKQAAAIPFVFNRNNYVIMIVGIVVILAGFLLMSGGASTDPNVFPKNEIYSFRRITLAPVVVFIGFGIEIFAILKRPKN